MLEKVKRFAKKWEMLSKEDKVIVGVSGGADSICLVLMLLELQKEIGFDMVAVHVNHGIRGEEADADEAYVKEFCKEHGIVCETYFSNVELIAKKRKQSTEEAGREVRRECFEEALKKHGGTKIALAHHMNDSAETFFLNLARGTGLKGLGGIAPTKGLTIRPLLCVKREEIETYLKKQGATYCVDRTNAEDAYTRNRIRNHVIPYIESHVNPKAVERMNETMEQIRVIQKFLEEQVEQYYGKTVIKKKNGLEISQELWKKIPEAIQPLLIRKVLIDISEKEKDLESVHIEQLSNLFLKQVGRKVDLPYHMEACRTYEGVLVCKKEEIQIVSDCVSFNPEDGEATFKWGSQQISCEVMDAVTKTGIISEKTYTGWFDCDIIKDNLCFRTRRVGDYITIHPDGRAQKLKAYFINQKIPKEERDQILLVADGSHILWIVGYRQNCLYKVKRDTKRAIKITINEGESHGRED